MIGCDPEFFLRHMFGTLLHDEGAIEIDLIHDRADLAQKVKVPMLVLWGDA
jgi:hypothetical protein